jgi:hypothetical protein
LYPSVYYATFFSSEGTEELLESKCLATHTAPCYFPHILQRPFIGLSAHTIWPAQRNINPAGNRNTTKRETPYNNWRHTRIDRDALQEEKEHGALVMTPRMIIAITREIIE